MVMAVNKFYMIYDDSCKLCRATAIKTARRDLAGSIQLVPLLAPSLPEGLTLPPRDSLVAELHLIGDDGSVRAGADAIARLAQTNFGHEGKRPVGQFSAGLSNCSSHPAAVTSAT